MALIVALAAVLLIGFAPYAAGLLGIPVLYVAFEPMNAWLEPRAPRRFGAALIVVLVLLLLLVGGGVAVGIIVSEARHVAQGAMQSPLLARLSTLQVGGFDVGGRLAEWSTKLVDWIGTSAFGFVGTASHAALNLMIACTGLYFLLLQPGETWDTVRRYIPFSATNVSRLQQRFRDVTRSALIGTGLSALLHGVLTGLAFMLAGLPNAALWGTVTIVFAILPVLGSGMVWGPGAVVLFLQHRPVAAAALAAWGVLVVGNVDHVVRPLVSRRWGHIHPLITLLGALVGVPYLGMLGLLIGPLALSYFFELITMYREEYLGV